jgi:hypothetical protein
MYLVFNVFYFYSGVGQKDFGVGRAHLPPPPFATSLSSNTKNALYVIDRGITSVNCFKR